MTARRGQAVLLAFLATAGASCSSTPGDPLEWLNRPIFAFNDAVDTVVFAPVVNFYTTVFPKPVQTGISNFFDNLRNPMVAVNNLLQGKPGDGASDLARFVVNSTVGIGGFLDVATSWGLEQHDEDIGQTLGTWGVGRGMYLVLPLLGPSTLRDAPGHALARVTSVFFFVDDTRITVPSSVFRALDLRARNDAGLKAMKDAALDRYVYTRESYLQRRLFLIHDGNPPKTNGEAVTEEEPGMIDLDAIK